MNGQDFRNLLNTLETVDNKSYIKEQWEKWGKFISEAGTKTKTKTQTKIDQDMFKGTDDTQVQATKKREPVKAPDASTRKRTQNVTLKKAVPMPDLDHIDKMIGKSDMDDDWGDLEMNAPQLTQEPTLSLGQDSDTDTTDMAINAPTDAKTTEIAQRIHDIEWVNMMDLPGNMSQVIRNLGRRVFAAFGEQDFEFIDVVSSITHDEEDLDVVSGLVRQFGVPVQKDAVIDFQDTIPGYKAHAGVWTFGTQYYMFIKDEMGEYIYTWDNRTNNQLPHIEPMGKDADKPLLNDINESYNNNLENVTYKGYTYDPEIEEDDDSSKLIHHITDPHGATDVAPDWFMNISPYEYPSAEQFKRAVDEISGN